MLDEILDNGGKDGFEFSPGGSFHGIAGCIGIAGTIGLAGDMVLAGAIGLAGTIGLGFGRSSAIALGEFRSTALKVASLLWADTAKHCGGVVLNQELDEREESGGPEA